MSLTALFLVVLGAPLLGSVLAGIFGKVLKDAGSHWATIILVAVSFGLSCFIFDQVVRHHLILSFTLYNFFQIDAIPFNVGFLVDRLTVFMMVIVTFVSLLVHIYSIGYMKGDPGNPRFFSYISGFTFAMLALVGANNFLILFFGWEGVGLFSYLLIGFWFERESANFAALKAFIANRVGDLGFLLGIAVVLMYSGSIDYETVFGVVPNLPPHVVTLACILLFIGAIGKSAQIPLHVWLEGSMEGPTPISALIHAATMVTAGVFMVARLSPLFEFSNTALSVVLIIGAATCFFMGLLGVVQFDIKRVIAYSTLSQLGYMMAAQGVSAYSLGMFHLMTHAAFKALLFLAAGSVIVALHHEQDMRKMGGLYKRMPVTYICMLVGALALSGIPPFAGFFSKDLLIDAVQISHLPGHSLAYFLLVAATLVTALYTFRMFFLTFHEQTKMSQDDFEHVHESSLSIILPLLILVIPAVLAGFIFFKPALNGFFGTTTLTLPAHAILPALTYTNNAGSFLVHKLLGLPCLLAVVGIIIAYLCYYRYPYWPAILAKRLRWLYVLLLNKYGFDELYDVILTGLTRLTGLFLWRVGDVFIIDRTLVEGTAKSWYGLGGVLRRLQTGLINHYLLVMILGLVLIMLVVVL